MPPLCERDIAIYTSHRFRIDWIAVKLTESFTRQALAAVIINGGRERVLLRERTHFTEKSLRTFLRGESGLETTMAWIVTRCR